GTTGNGLSTKGKIDPDNLYGVSETVPAGWKFEGSSISGDLNGAGTPGSFHVLAGGTVTVTFNDSKLATIIVAKNSLGGNGTFTFPTTGGDNLPSRVHATALHALAATVGPRLRA